MEYPLVSTQWLEDHLHQGQLVLLDASMATVIGREPRVYAGPICIPSSRRFDIEQDFCDTQSRHIHALPTLAQFIQGAAKLGITPDSTVVVYDNQGIYSSPRAWWIFKLMGFERVYVLDGGLPQWLAEDRLTSSHYQTPGQDYQQGAAASLASALHYRPELVVDAEAVLAKISDKLDADTAIIDARARGRFLGQMSEPRPGVRSGHIPHAVNLPFAEVLNGDKLKSAQELQALFATLGADKPLRIFSCGSGITACILLLASAAAGHERGVLYAGSWADWGSRSELPIASGG
ncbi:MAG: sulfurtransferase [Shewanella sp.]